METRCESPQLGSYAGARETLNRARRAGIVLWAEGDGLRYRVPPGTAASGLECQLVANRDAIRAELDRPLYKHSVRQGDTLRYPEHWRDFWWETRANLSLANLTHATISITGGTRASTIAGALQTLAARHEVLRARVQFVDGLPSLEYQPAGPLPLTVETIHDFASESGARTAAECLQNTIWAPLENGQVFRACILESDGAECIVAFVVDHFVGDFFSCGIVARELLELLRGPARSTGPARTLPLQYSDYHLGMNQWLKGRGAEYRLCYWRQHLAGVQPARLAVDSEVQSSAPTHLGTVELAVDEQLRAGMAQLAVAARVSVPIIALAANFAALAEVLGHEDIIVTLIGSGRDQPALMGMVGNTVNTFPVRVTVSAPMLLCDLLERVAETYALARDYQLPWALIQQELGSRGTQCAGPTFNYMQHRHTPVRGTSSSLPETAGRAGRFVVEAPVETSTVGWKSHEVNIADYGDSLSIKIKYATSRYRRERIARFGQVLLRYLQAFVQEPRQPVADIRAQRP